MKTKLTIDEATGFKQAGFKIKRELVIKKKEVITNVAELTTGISAVELEGEQTSECEYVVFNVTDRHDNLIFSEENEEDLISSIKMLVSPLT